MVHNGLDLMQNYSYEVQTQRSKPMHSTHLMTGSIIPQDNYSPRQIEYSHNDTNEHAFNSLCQPCF